MIIKDRDGNVRDWPWLTEKFGLTPDNVTQGEIWKVTVLQEGGPEATLNVYGPPGTVVTWGWGDGSITGVIEPKGSVGFGMGHGAYYYPPAIGPHYVQIEDMKVEGLGMIGATEHEHVDVTVSGSEYTGPQYFDESGNEQGVAWAVDQFGTQEISDPQKDQQFNITELRANYGYEKVLGVTILDEYGLPLSDVSVVLGPRDVGGSVHRAVTDEAGYAYFYMDDAYKYYVSGPTDQGHWSAAVEQGHSQVYNSVGWVFLGNRKPGRWFNIVFQLSGYVPPTEDHTLTTHVVGEGIVEPSGGTYNHDTEIMLLAQAEENWRFTGWQGDLSGTENPTVLVMDSDKDISATFIENSGDLAELILLLESAQSNLLEAVWDVAAARDLAESLGV